MARTCSICEHSDRPRMDRELTTGARIRGVARKYRVSEDALARHRSHIAAAVVRAGARKGERLEDSLLDQIRSLTARAWALLDKLEADGDLRGAVIGLRETRETLTALNGLVERAGGEQGSVCPECRNRHAREFAEDIQESLRVKAREYRAALPPRVDAARQ